MTDGRSFVRNAALNLVGIVVPLLLAVAAIPPLVRGLGPDRFGILALAWAVIGYFSLFELGLGRALTQAVAHRLGTRDDREIPSLVWTTLALLLGLGILAAVVLWVATPALVTRALSIPNPLHGEAIVCFYLLSLALPLVLMTAGLRGLMEAHQHFGAINAIRIPLSAVTFLGPLATLPFSRSLTPAILVLVVGRAVGWVVHFAVCLRRYESLRSGMFVKSVIQPLVRYGGWTTVSNVVSPIMVYMDRFLIGAVLSLAAVTHYVTPYEVVTKLMVIPGSIVSAVFPAFAATFVSDRERMAQLYDRSQRMVLLVIFPLALGAITLAHEGLRLWMGPALPRESAIVLQWLAVGIFINAIAHAPLAALQGADRPDLVARIHLVELPLYLLGLWFLTDRFGIVGVAIAWTLRATVDALALLAVSHRALGLSSFGGRVGAQVFGVMVIALVGATAFAQTRTRVLYLLIGWVVFAWASRQYLIRATERTALRDWLRSARLSRRPEVA